MRETCEQKGNTSCASPPWCTVVAEAMSRWAPLLQVAGRAWLPSVCPPPSRASSCTQTCWSSQTHFFWKNSEREGDSLSLSFWRGYRATCSYQLRPNVQPTAVRKSCRYWPNSSLSGENQFTTISPSLTQVSVKFSWTMCMRCPSSWAFIFITKEQFLSSMKNFGTTNFSLPSMLK